MSQYEINPINSWCNDEVGKLLANRIANMPVLQRIEAVSMCQMFSFWREVQDCMILAAEEIKTLKAKIEQLESRSTT